MPRQSLLRQLTLRQDLERTRRFLGMDLDSWPVPRMVKTERLAIPISTRKAWQRKEHSYQIFQRRPLRTGSGCKVCDCGQVFLQRQRRETPKEPLQHASMHSVRNFRPARGMFLLLFPIRVSASEGITRAGSPRWMGLWLVEEGFFFDVRFLAGETTLFNHWRSGWVRWWR